MSGWRGGDRVTADGDPRQCTYIRRRFGARCRHFAMRGKTKCPQHGGHREGTANDRVRLYHLPRFYRSVLSKTLSAFVAECLDQSPHEQLTLLEELAVARGMACQVLALHTAAESMPEETPEQRAAKQGATTASAMLTRDWLTWVAEMTERATRVAATARDKVSATDVQGVLNQVVRIAYDVFGNDPKAQQLEQALRDEIRVIESAAGTSITPDADALAMDASVPKDNQ